MPPFVNPYWNDVPYMHGELTMNASDLLELLSPPKGNDLYRNITYDREKMQYIKPGEVCDFGVKKGDNNMNNYDGFDALLKQNILTDAPTRILQFDIPPIQSVEKLKDDAYKLIQLRDERDQARLNYVDVLRREHENERKAKNAMTIENVIFNPPATIVFWADGTKTVVKCQDDEPFAFDPEKGLAMAFMKKMLGNKGNYYNTVDKWVQPYWQAEYVKRQKEIEQR